MVMRFLCDEMLVRLARLLRAAGYDTYLAAGGEPDAELIKTARREGRILITRDKRLAAATEESVLVGGWGVLAASYEAKACGVYTPMSLGAARRLCPDAVVVEPRMSAYSEASRDVYRVFEETTPHVEGLSIEEAFLDVSGLERISGSPIEIAAR